MTNFDDDKIQKQKALIGSFIIEFEELCDIVRGIILNVCYPNHNKKQKLNIEILLEGLTADPIRKKLEALIFDNFQNETELLEYSKKVSDKFSDLIPQRNTIAHGLIVNGFSSFDGDIDNVNDTFLHKHVKITKKGVDRNIKIVNISEIEKLKNQTRWINSAYFELYMIIKKIRKGENYGAVIKSLDETLLKIGRINFEHKLKREK